MSRKYMILMAVMAGVLAQAMPSGANAPVIQHKPITTAAAGQSLPMRAQVSPGTSPIKSVTLFVTLSDDAAPVKLPMQLAGGSSYAGIIPGNLLEGQAAFSYYIEAVNRDGFLAETAWHKVRVVSVEPGAAGSAASSLAPARYSGGGAAEDVDEQAWVKPALIAGGAVAAAGVVIWAVSGSGGGGGGGGDDSPEPDSITAGTYLGNAISCTSSSSGNKCDSYPVAIVITEDGYATSDTLHPGQYLTAPVSGREFVMTVRSTDSSLVGEHYYVGNILDGKIVGQISGSGTQGSEAVTFSGSFSATRQ